MRYYVWCSSCHWESAIFDEPGPAIDERDRHATQSKHKGTQLRSLRRPQDGVIDPEAA